MSLSNVYTAGLGNVGSYQVSGIPFASGNLDATGGTALKVTFPYVTRWVQIINHDTTELTCSFASGSLSATAGANCFKLHRTHGTNEGYYTPRFEWKVTEMWFTGSSDFDVIAGLTNISVDRINNLSGSGDIVGNNWSGSVGVG
jgi:hypothetical protein